MENYRVTRGCGTPEVYFLGFNGTHFQFFVTEQIWNTIRSLTGAGTPFASRFTDYVPPSEESKPFGIAGCATLSQTLDGMLAINIPAMYTGHDNEQKWGEVHNYARMINLLTWLIFPRVIDELIESSALKDTENRQLFDIETCLAPPSQYFHGAGLDLSVSPVARRYLESLGSNVSFSEIEMAMCKHDQTISSYEGKRLWLDSFGARIRTNGLLEFHTLGECACLGAAPREYREDEGYCLSSHNVDTPNQQFCLLIGIAGVWQKVRTGLGY